MTLTLTPAEEELINAIRQCADVEGIARSLFRIVAFSQLDYKHAHTRLSRLQQLGVITISRTDGRGRPLALKVTD